MPLQVPLVDRNIDQEAWSAKGCKAAWLCGFARADTCFRDGTHRAIVEDQVVDAADGHARSLAVREERKALRHATLPVHLRRLVPAAKLRP